MMKFAVLTTGLMAVAATSAMAQESMHGWAASNGIYGSVKGGWTKAEDQKFDNTGVKSDMEDGWGASAAVGKTYGNMRAEVEGLYLTNDVNNADVNGVTAGSGGDTELSAAMVNGYYDFKNSSPVTPYVGAGVGYGKLDVNGHAVAGVSNISGDDDVMAYQAMAGVGYELNPCWTLTGEYRYVGTTKADIGSTDVRYKNHAVMAGLRYTF